MKKVLIGIIIVSVTIAVYSCRRDPVNHLPRTASFNDSLSEYLFNGVFIPIDKYPDTTYKNVIGGWSIYLPNRKEGFEALRTPIVILEYQKDFIEIYPYLSASEKISRSGVYELTFSHFLLNKYDFIYDRCANEDEFKLLIVTLYKYIVVQNRLLSYPSDEMYNMFYSTSMIHEFSNDSLKYLYLRDSVSGHLDIFLNTSLRLIEKSFRGPYDLYSETVTNPFKGGVSSNFKELTREADAFIDIPNQIDNSYSEYVYFLNTFDLSLYKLMLYNKGGRIFFYHQTIIDEDLGADTKGLRAHR